MMRPLTCSELADLQFFQTGETRSVALGHAFGTLKVRPPLTHFPMVPHLRTCSFPTATTCELGDTRCFLVRAHLTI